MQKFFSSLIHKPFSKQLNNLDRSVVTGNSETYRIDYLSGDFPVNHLNLGC